MIVSSLSGEAMGSFMVGLGAQLAFKKLGGANYWIRYHISSDRPDNELRLDLNLFTKTVEDRFDVTKKSHLSAPAGWVPLSRKDGSHTPAEEVSVRNIPHREAMPCTGKQWRC